MHCHLIGGADAGVTPVHADPKRRSDHSGGGGGSARTSRRTTDAPSAASALIGRVVVLFLVPGGLVILLPRRLPLLLVAGRGQTGGFASRNVRRRRSAARQCHILHLPVKGVGGGSRRCGHAVARRGSCCCCRGRSHHRRSLGRYGRRRGGHAVLLLMAVVRVGLRGVHNINDRALPALAGEKARRRFPVVIILGLPSLLPLMQWVSGGRRRRRPGRRFSVSSSTTSSTTASPNARPLEHTLGAGHALGLHGRRPGLHLLLHRLGLLELLRCRRRADRLGPAQRRRPARRARSVR